MGSRNLMLKCACGVIATVALSFAGDEAKAPSIDDIDVTGLRIDKEIRTTTKKDFGPIIREEAVVKVRPAPQVKRVDKNIDQPIVKEKYETDGDRKNLLVRDDNRKSEDGGKVEDGGVISIRNENIDEDVISIKNEDPIEPPIYTDPIIKDGERTDPGYDGEKDEEGSTVEGSDATDEGVISIIKEIDVNPEPRDPEIIYPPVAPIDPDDGDGEIKPLPAPDYPNIDPIREKP